MTIMFAYLQSTRVERPAMQTSRQRKDFAQIFLLVKWDVAIDRETICHFFFKIF